MIPPKVVRVRDAVWANLAVIALLCSIVPGTYLIIKNRQLINAGKRDSIASCKHTYDSFREVFEPFFPVPKKQNEGQKLLLRKLDKTIERLKPTCDRPAQPVKIKEKK